jgi:mannose-6-phosphate isomerase-like protein (cupin superfamily)
VKAQIAIAAAAVLATVLAGAAQQPQAPPAPATTTLAQRIVHTTPTSFRSSKGVHGGAGQLDFAALLNANAFDTNMHFVHRGVIQPKGGIGAHFHNQCEEMFVILDGEAQFTIDGRTSVLKGPAGAPVRMGHSHAIYNHTDKPVQWLNLNVTARKGVYDNFDLGDPRVGVPIDPIPNFISMRLDRELARPMNPASGAKGTVRYRRMLEPPVFLTAWAYVDHLVLTPGSATATQALPDLGETFYVVAGEGKIAVGTESAVIRAGDAIPVRMGEGKSFEQSGAEPLELLIVGVARDAASKYDIVNAARAATGGRGRGNQP